MKTKQIRGGISRKIFKNKVLRVKILSPKGLVPDVSGNSGCKRTCEGQRTTELKPGRTILMYYFKNALWVGHFVKQLLMRELSIPGSLSG